MGQPLGQPASASSAEGLGRPSRRGTTHNFIRGTRAMTRTRKVKYTRYPRCGHPPSPSRLLLTPCGAKPRPISEMGCFPRLHMSGDRADVAHARRSSMNHLCEVSRGGTTPCALRRSIRSDATPVAAATWSDQSYQPSTPLIRALRGAALIAAGASLGGSSNHCARRRRPPFRNDQTHRSVTI